MNVCSSDICWQMPLKAKAGTNIAMEWEREDLLATLMEIDKARKVHNSNISFNCYSSVWLFSSDSPFTKKSDCLVLP